MKLLGSDDLLLCRQAAYSVDYLRDRGLQGKRSAYDRVLRRVRDVAPEEGDALPNKERKQTKRG